MYIEPNTNIKILKDVPLDTTYDHTIYFSSASAQTNYFAGLTKYNLTSQTYQRVKRGYARVQRKAEDLYDCNYMMFQNSSYGNKWFYAFITSVEYVNNVTSEITFEIDDMQTWFFDFTLDMCYVEREHSVTDEIGEYILPEPVEVGEMVFNDYNPITNIPKTLGIVVAISNNQDTYYGKVFEGVFSGCTYYGFNSTVEAEIEYLKAELLNKYIQSPDSVVGMWMCPFVFFSGQRDPSTYIINHTDSGSGFNTYSQEGDLPTVSSTDTLNGYKPKNNKMYTYPYNYLQIDNGMNSSICLRYEFFNGLQPQIEISGTVNAPVKCTIRPVNYKGSGVGDKTQMVESLTLQNYPMCSWNIDAYKVWIAQNMKPMILNTMTSLIGTSSNLLTTTMSGGFKMPYSFMGEQMNFQGLVSGLHASNTIMDVITSNTNAQYTASIQADPCKGELQNSNLNIAQNKQTFFGGRVSVQREYAQLIDNFFTKYGYATKTLKIPNTHSRPHWNYVKTIGCTATGSIPADAMRHICSIHDSGITYWKNGNEIGNYSLDNSPN